MYMYSTEPNLDISLSGLQLLSQAVGTWGQTWRGHEDGCGTEWKAGISWTAGTRWCLFVCFYNFFF